MAEKKKEVKETAKVTEETKNKEVKEVAENKTKSEKKIVEVKDLEAEYGIKAKVIRRHLRQIEESTKPRNSEKYQWWEDSKELAEIRKNLEQIIQKKQPR